MMSKKMIKVICVIMAGLMLLSVFAVALQVFAADGDAVKSFISPATGDNGSDYYIPIGIGVAAVLAVVLCLVLPKMKKTNSAGAKAKTSEEKKASESIENPKKK